MIAQDILAAYQRKDFVILIVLTSILWMVPLWSFASTEGHVGHDEPPSIFRIYSPSGNETFQVDCRPLSTDSVTCNFMGARINPAERDGVIGSQLKKLYKLSSLERKQLQKEFASDATDLTKAMKDKLNDPNLGPKSKAFFQESGAAYEKGDFTKVLQLLAQREKRTCTVDTQSFSLTFQRIGKWKWVSNPGPAGMCNILKVYELNAVSFRNEKRTLLNLQWKMIETRVAGDSTQPMCADVEQELHKPTIWSWDNPSDYELPCDFIHFRTLIAR